MKYEQQDIAILAAELRRFTQAVIGGPHDRAADVLLDLYDEVDRYGRLLAECQNLCLLKTRENNRFRRLLNLKSLPLLRNTVDADIPLLLDLHNAARAKASWLWKLQPLVANDSLTNYAQTHANYMAENNTLTHSTLLRIKKLGFTHVAENIAWGQTTPDSVLRSWLWSPGHRVNIMSRTYDSIGAGAAKDSKGRLYWCVCFGKS